MTRMTPLTLTTPGTASSRASGVVASLLFFVATAALIAGPAFWINGLTQPVVRIDGELSRSIPVPLLGQLPPPAGASVAVPTNGMARVTVRDASVQPDGTGVHLNRSTKLLWRSDTLVLSLAIAAGALLLGRLARDIGAGRAFHDANPRRIALVALCVAAGGTVPGLLSWASLTAALDNAGMLSHEPLLNAYRLDLAPLAAAAVILVLAQAFRQGTQVTRDVEGLV